MYYKYQETERFVCSSVALILSCEMLNLGGSTAALDIWCPATGELLSKTTTDVYCSAACWIRDHSLWDSSLCKEEFVVFVGCWGCLGILMLGARLGLWYSLELTFVLWAVFVKANYSVSLFIVVITLYIDLYLFFIVAASGTPILYWYLDFHPRSCKHHCL